MHTHKNTQFARRFLNRGLVAGLLLTQTALSAYAQAPAATDEKKDDDKEKVVVLDAYNVRAGFAGSLAAAAETKQKNVLITEVIAAEDIGKLPDISIAESLTRLPGLATQRLNGRAQAIVIRGLEGDYSVGLLNGREQVSTNANRTVEYDQYPAELLSGVTVYKATESSLVSQGLVGTIDMQTVRPLSQGKRVVAANAFYEWNSMGAINAGAKSSGNRETFSYIDQFMDRKLGIAYGYSRSDRPGQGKQWNAWGYPNVDSGTSSSTPLVIGGAKPFVRSSQIERDGHMAVIEFAPNDKVRSTVDLFYSDFRETQLLRGIEIPLWWSSAQLQPGFTVTNGLITQGTFKNVYGVVRNDIVQRNDHLFSGGWKLELGDKNGWKTDLDIGLSRVKRRDLVLETYSGYASNQAGTPDTLGFTMGSGTGAVFTHQLDYSNGTLMKLQNPQGWASDQFPGGQAGFVKGPYARDMVNQYVVTTQKPMSGFFKRVEAGVSYKRRSKYEYDLGPDGTEGYFLGFKNGASSAALPATVGLTDLSFIGMGQMYSYDPLALYNSGFYATKPNLNPALRANNFDVTEKIYTTYLKFDIEHKIGSVPMTGNIGAQLIQADQGSNGVAIGSTTTVNVHDGHKYTDFVPSLNLNFQFTEKTQLRLSAARQLARPRMVDMRAGNTFGYNQTLAASTDPLNGPWSRSGGNPHLEPTRANSLDVSLEHYFADSMGYWSITGFTKSLKSYTYNKTQIVSFEGYPTGIAVGNPGATPAIYLGTSNAPANGQGGYLRGLEFSLSIAGEKFSPVLKGFGFIGNTAFQSSSIQPDPSNPSQPLPGFSDRVSSATFYYEHKKGFAGRVSVRHRSDFRGDISTFGPRGVNYRNLQSETNVDAQVSYAFKSGALKGLTLIAQGYNLNNEPVFASSGPDTRLVQDYQEYGATYSIGASYKF